MVRLLHVFTLYLVLLIAAVVAVCLRCSLGAVMWGVAAGNVAAVACGWLGAAMLMRQFRRRGVEFLRRAPSPREMIRTIILIVIGLALAWLALELMLLFRVDALDARFILGIVLGYAAIGALLGAMGVVRYVERATGRRLYTGLFGGRRTHHDADEQP